jgi:hypothetical protein
VSTQLICHPAFIVGVAGIYKCLKMLDIVLITIELELDHLGCAVCDLEVHELKIDIIVQADGLKLVREIVVIRHTQQALHGRKGCHEKDHSVHTTGIDR